MRKCHNTSDGSGLFEHPTVPWENAYTIFIDKRPQFMPKFFAALYVSVGTELDTKSENYPQSNGQVEKCLKRR